MKFTSYFPAVALVPAIASASEATCPEETSACQDRVVVSVTEIVYGLKDDAPDIIFDTFSAAASQCLQCVDQSDVSTLHAGNYVMTKSDCKYSCCGVCTQSSWDWTCRNYDGTTKCPSQCIQNYYPECADRRRLNAPYGRILQFDEKDDDDDENDDVVVFEVDVCMDYISPLDVSRTSYVDYTDMLADFQKELAECIGDRDKFYSTWSDLSAQKGVNLSTLAARYDSGESITITFGYPGVNAESATVTSYDSSNDHKATRHVIFYAALGFIVASIFAVGGAALVVRVMKSNKEDRDDQETSWVYQITRSRTLSRLSKRFSSPLSAYPIVGPTATEQDSL